MRMMLICDDDIDDDDETLGGWNNTVFPDFFLKTLKEEKFVREERTLGTFLS